MLGDLRAECSRLENDGQFRRANRMRPFLHTGLHVRSMCGQPTCPTTLGSKTGDSASAPAFDMLSKCSGVPHGTATDKPGTSMTSEAPVAEGRGRLLETANARGSRRKRDFQTDARKTEVECKPYILIRLTCQASPNLCEKLAPLSLSHATA